MKSLLNHNLLRKNAAGMHGQLKGFNLGKNLSKQHLVSKKMFGANRGFRNLTIGKKFTSKHSLPRSTNMGIEPSMEELEKMLKHESSGAYGSSVRKKKRLFGGMK